MELSIETIPGFPRITLVRVAGRVDGSNYLSLIEKARTLLAAGPDCLLLDLQGCSHLSSAGLFALHNIALIANQYQALDHEDGWGAMKRMADETRELKGRFKLIQVPEKIMTTLQVSGLSALYEIHPDLQAALAALVPV